MADQTGKASTAFARVAATIGVLVLFAVLLGLVVFFVVNHEHFDNAKEVLSFIVGVGSSLGVIGYLAVRLKRGIARHGTASRALVRFVAEEPLIHAMIWIFLVAQVLVFSYLLPVIRLRVEVTDGMTGDAVAPERVDEITLLWKGRSMDLKGRGTAGSGYVSRQGFAWSDLGELEIRVQAKEYQRYEAVVGRPVFPLWDIVRGCLKNAPLSPEGPVRTMICVDPPSATIRVSAPQDTVLQDHMVLETQRNERVVLDVSAHCCEERSLTHVARKDSTLTITLKRKPGRAVFRGVNENGDPLRNMDVYIYTDSGRITGRTGEVIELLPGSYRVQLFRQLSSADKGTTEVFPIVIRSCDDTTEVTRTVGFGRL